eukprot:38186-Pleurochrysis_carterae.AAC.1
MRVMLLLGNVVYAACPRGLPTPWKPPVNPTTSGLSNSFKSVANASCSSSAFTVAASIATGAAILGAVAYSSRESAGVAAAKPAAAAVFTKKKRKQSPFQRPLSTIPEETSHEATSNSFGINTSCAHSVCSTNAFQPDECDWDEESIHSEGEDEWSATVDPEAFDEPPLATECDEDGKPKRPSPPKLWNKSGQFPSGFFGAKNYDFRNLFAAQRWSCPCIDRPSCLSPDRLEVEE